MKKATVIITALFLLLSVFTITSSAEDTREYCIKVKTADVSDASTCGEVDIIVYGENGHTGAHELDDDNNNFQTDGLDTFYISDIDVGEIKCIKIVLHSSYGDSWCCDWIDIDGVQFELGGYWLSDSDEKDIKFINALPGDEPDGKCYETFSPGEQTNVDVTVKTYTQSGSGTDGDVYIRLYSSTGATVTRELASGGNDFELGDCDTYSFWMMDLKEIVKIDIWHIGTVQSDKWCLSYVKIGDLIFNANGRWLGHGEGITLYPTDDIFYNIRIDTQDELWSGTDSDIYVKYIGDNGETEWTPLDNPDNNDFEKGDSDSYETLGKDIGTVRKIKLKNDGSDEWRIARVYFQGVTYHMNGKALEESETEIIVNYTGASSGRENTYISSLSGLVMTKEDGKREWSMDNVNFAKNVNMLFERGYNSLWFDFNQKAYNRLDRNPTETSYYCFAPFALGYQTTTDRNEAVTGIVIYNGENSGATIESNGITYTLMGGWEFEDEVEWAEGLDLNRFTGGDYLYLYYTKDTKAGKPITALMGSNSDTAPGYECVPDTSGNAADLNSGSKMDEKCSVYLLCQREASTAGSVFGGGDITTVIIIAAAVIVLGAVIVFFMKKRKA